MTTTNYSVADVPELIPARMLASFAYCPRSAHIEWRQKGFVDNEFTVEGRFQHRRVDDEGGKLPSAGDVENHHIHARSVWLTAPLAGLTARLDLLESEGPAVTPVEYKHGKVPDNPERSYDSQRIQVCVQALVLRENGYSCDRGVIYYVDSRRRVEVAIDESLTRRTSDLAKQMRCALASSEPPVPLVDSARCEGCSLVGVCLPDEVNHLRSPSDGLAHPRRLMPSRDDDLSVCLHGYGTRVRVEGEELVVEFKDRPAERVAFRKLAHVTLFKGPSVTTPALHRLASEGIPVSFCGAMGAFHGMLVGLPTANIDLRRVQFRAAEDRAVCLELSRKFVVAKARNCRTLLRRNSANGVDSILDRMKELIDDAEKAESVESLLGIEGMAARLYFGAFGSMLKPSDDEAVAFDFEGRNRQPPRDPVNSMLSYLYSCLTSEVTRIVMAVGFDPFMGFYHRPGYGRASLALDLMEEFRPIIVDSVVLKVINQRQVSTSNFEKVGAGVYLTGPAKTAVTAAYVARLDEVISHPLFDYKLDYRRVIEVQARLLGQFLLGQVPEYRGFVVR